MATPSIQSRIKGSIFGVAVADALGAPVEFRTRGSFPPVTGHQHNSTFNVPAGTWTDDTSMTLCLAKSLIGSNGVFVSQDATRKYIEWYQHGYLSATEECFDIGGSTRQALEIWESFFRQKPDIAKDDPGVGQTVINKVLSFEVRCGNGSLMRVAPVGLVYYRDMDLAISVAARSSDVTHPFPTCAECCVIYTKLIVRTLNGASKKELAEEVANTTFSDKKIKDRLGRYPSLQEWVSTPDDDIKSSGFVVSTLEAALWAFFTTDSFDEGALRAVNLGYDADTVGAVYGGLAGAYYGVANIHPPWIEELQKREVVDEIATALASLSSS